MGQRAMDGDALTVDEAEAVEELVALLVPVPVGVLEGVPLAVGLLEPVPEPVPVPEGAPVGVSLFEGDPLALGVREGVGVSEGVAPSVRDAEGVAAGEAGSEGVEVGEGVGVAVRVPVLVAVPVGVLEGVREGEGVPLPVPDGVGAGDAEPGALELARQPWAPEQGVGAHVHSAPFGTHVLKSALRGVRPPAKTVASGHSLSAAGTKCAAAPPTAGMAPTASRRRAGGSVKWKRGCHVT